MDAGANGDAAALRNPALTLAIERGEWERILLHLFITLAETLRTEPNATIDDLLELLEGIEAARDD